jgi:hypothetical protein
MTFSLEVGRFGENLLHRPIGVFGMLSLSTLSSFSCDDDGGGEKTQLWWGRWMENDDGCLELDSRPGLRLDSRGPRSDLSVVFHCSWSMQVTELEQLQQLQLSQPHHRMNAELLHKVTTPGSPSIL